MSLKSNWTDDYQRRREYAKGKEQEERDSYGITIDKLKEVPLDKCVKEFKPEQFEKELKALRKEVQKISLSNKIGDPRKSNYGHKRALSDTDAIYCRLNRKDYTVIQLAEKFGVSERCVNRCVRGLTYKHLNSRYKPWF